MVVIVQLVREQGEAIFEEGEFIVRRHCPRDIDKKYQIRSRAILLADFFSLNGDADQFVIWLPGVGADLLGDQKGNRFVFRRGVIVVEVVHHFFDPNRAAGDFLPVLDHAADVGVGRGVNVDAPVEFWPPLQSGRSKFKIAGFSFPEQN